MGGAAWDRTGEHSGVRNRREEGGRTEYEEQSGGKFIIWGAIRRWR